MLRLYLPPNLAAAAPRDAIAVKVDIDPTAPLVPEFLPALALLQRWAGTPTPPKFLQLKRAQLRDLITALRDKPVFFWLNGPAAPIAWNDDGLAGASIFLKVAISPAKAAFARTTLSASGERASGLSAPRSSTEPGAKARLTVDGSEHYLAITLPSRESLSYDSTLELLKTAGFTLDPSTRRWWLRDRHKTLNFLATHGDRLRKNLGAEFTPNFEKNTAHLREAEVVCDAVEARNGFSLTVALKAGTADEGQIRAAVSSNRGYIESDGKVYLLAADKLQKLDATQRALGGDAPGNTGLATRRTHAVSSARAVAAQTLLEEIAPHFQPPAAWRARTDALRNLSALAPAPIAAAFASLLRPYQKLGVAWLWHLFRHELGGILADEMGLGKTLQALGLLSAVAGSNTSPSPTPFTSGRRTSAGTPLVSSPFSASGFARVSLVVCPASLVENWRREAARFTPHLRIFVHHGERRLSTPEAFGAHDLVVTSYGTLTRDRALFESVEFACVIADEAQHIKNRRSQNAQSLRALRARGRFLLTGTPLENSLEDLRSLFEFLMPGYLDKVPPGMRGEDRAWIDERLHAQTAPYILRRTKQAVAPELPAKLEHTLWCELTPAQAKLYHETQQRTEREFMDLAATGASEASLRFAALTQLLRLRQICCDPRLIPGSNGAAASTPDSASVDQTPGVNPQPQPPFGDSAKLDAFRELLAESIDDNHRLLVFSQFTSLLGLLREELVAQEITHCYLDGSMTPRARQAEVDRFQGSSEIPVFLISLKAGGTGLNLTGADTVVHFDPWWNPAAEAQATDRAHRIGQTRVVTSYKLIASGTVEEKVLALQDEKRALLAGVFEASDAAAAKLSLSDLKSLLSA